MCLSVTQFTCVVFTVLSLTQATFTDLSSEQMNLMREELAHVVIFDNIKKPDGVTLEALELLSGDDFYGQKNSLSQNLPNLLVGHFDKLPDYFFFALLNEVPNSRFSYSAGVLHSRGEFRTKLEAQNAASEFVAGLRAFTLNANADEYVEGAKDISWNSRSSLPMVCRSTPKEYLEDVYEVDGRQGIVVYFIEYSDGILLIVYNLDDYYLAFWKPGKQTVILERNSRPEELLLKRF